MVRPARLSGSIRVPGDKSIAHRALLLAAIARGESRIRGLPQGEDVAATLGVIQGLGVAVMDGGSEKIVEGRGFAGLLQPGAPLDCGNSGTTIRLAAGLAAGRPFETVLTAGEQLSRRPMDRILAPLARMGARVESRDGKPPLRIHGGKLRGIEYELPVASAQVKSCLLLAGLAAEGTTSVTEPSPTRDHTERLLAAMGASIETLARTIRVRAPGAALSGLDMDVPGDFSSAAFFLAAALVAGEGEIRALGVGTNSTRTGFLKILARMGATVEVARPGTSGGEPVADLVARPAALVGAEISGELVPLAIDELPLVAVLGAFARGRTILRDAAELRVKESDRIEGVVAGLAAMGARIEERPDGFEVEGPCELRGTTVDAGGDHRIAMSLAIAALAARGETVIRGADSVAKSYPTFFADLERLRA
ncbi:MAG: 3-phosphoshikimate 1-carboxyvinyltransferase [Planctomycetes bacterium]|nr:3-phosphoshikimate 1-carboxyvinyltransferase [Planctomycetota bacterium]